jgi:hypothetical protein
VVTFGLEAAHEHWMARDYLHELAASNRESFPPLSRVLEALPPATVEPLLAPHDCSDRMFATLWARPEEYLDPRVREASSIWHQLPESETSRALDELRPIRADLSRG